MPFDFDDPRLHARLLARLFVCPDDALERLRNRQLETPLDDAALAQARDLLHEIARAIARGEDDAEIRLAGALATIRARPSQREAAPEVTRDQTLVMPQPKASKPALPFDSHGVSRPLASHLIKPSFGAREASWDAPIEHDTADVNVNALLAGRAKTLPFKDK